MDITARSLARILPLTMAVYALAFFSLGATASGEPGATRAAASNGGDDAAATGGDEARGGAASERSVDINERSWDEAVRRACWTLAEDEIVEGVREGARSMRATLGESDREEAESIALLKAWRGLRVEHLESPRAWARVIARNTARDLLRRRNADPLAGAGDEALLERQPAALDDPEAAAQRAELALLHERVAAWPEAERQLAAAFLEGEVDTVTAAARWVRDRAPEGVSAMYPAKAKLLLEARRGELEELG